MPKPEKLSVRELLVQLHADHEKTNYLLVTVVAVVTGGKVIGSPPETVIGLLAVIASSVFALLMLGRAWDQMGPIRWVMFTLIVLASTVLLSAQGLDGLLMQTIFILRLLLSGTIFYWAWKLPRPRIELVD